MVGKGMWIVVATAVVLAGCRAPSAVARVYPSPKPDPWVLSCTDPTLKTPALLWNGLIGVRVGRDGSGWGADGAMLPVFSINRYEPGAEEKIQTLPNPFAGRWQVNGTTLDPLRGDDYAQSLDMRTGVLTTSWTQKLGPVAMSIRCDAVAHPDAPLVVQQWTLSKMPRALVEYRARVCQIPPPPTPPAGTNLSGVTSSYSVEGGVGGDQGTLRTEGNDEVWRCEVSAGGQIRFARALTVDSGEVDKSFGRVSEAAQKAWAARWKTDIEIDGPIEDQQAVRSFLFYLRSAIHPKGGMAISPMGLSSSTYNGHVFWDADIWVFPALALIDPSAAKAIPDYRLRMFGRPSRAGGDDAPPSKAAPFPWESSVTGREVAPAAMRNEIHINGDVAFMLNQAAALGLADRKAAWRVKEAAAAYYRARSAPGTGDLHELRGVTSPDENRTGDNDLYTNLLANWCNAGVPLQDSQFVFKLPKDARSYLTYDGDPIRSYKQAAAVLAIYPLQMVDDKQARVMMDRFADKVTKNGPAMSHSLHALIWARLGESKKAYETWKESWGAYTNHPLMLFSEKPRKEETYFTTGAAGCLQTVIYGFLGFRIDYIKDSMAAWSNALNGEDWLAIKPKLPAAWKSVKFKNFTVRGKRYTLTVDASGVKVIQGES